MFFLSGKENVHMTVSKKTLANNVSGHFSRQCFQITAEMDIFAWKLELTTNHYLMRKTLLMLACMLGTMLWAQKKYELTSPDGTVQSQIEVGQTLTYDIRVDGRTVLLPSTVQMTTSDATAWKGSLRLKKAKRSAIDQEIASPFTRQATMQDKCNVLTLHFANDCAVEFRAYDNGVCYRFISNRKEAYRVLDETVEYRLPSDPVCTVPYTPNFDEKNPGVQFETSFENYYTTARLSELDPRRYSFLPLIVDAGEGVKLCLTESHLENYPGLYLQATAGTLKGVFAAHPKELKQGGHNNLQMKVVSREDYIARVEGARPFPWRIAMISRNDTELAENNLSYILGAPSRVEDISWIRPGKVAWDWWNDWNIGGVDFRSGVNNDTYKHYIDFASEKGIEYVILDEGWAVNLKADLMQVVPDINLPELVAYADARNVGLILWAGYRAFERDMEQVCRHYSNMGIKGFKVDFMDRDDQPMTDFYYRAAAMCANYKMLVDFHGAFKPAGLCRTFPNAINFEGVCGLEQMKWKPAGHDQVTYDTQIPFIRQSAGPMDYTQGAMLNAAKGTYHPNNAEPMSQGTRCHQLGLYMILESPLSMLCDSPTKYRTLGGPCVDFIAQVPTVWDETRVLAGEMGHYIVTARRKGDVWYVGGITNWSARDVDIPTSFLGNGTWKVQSFIDGTNAHRLATDYKFTAGQECRSGESIHIHMAPGGGFALRFAR